MRPGESINLQTYELIKRAGNSDFLLYDFPSMRAKFYLVNNRIANFAYCIFSVCLSVCLQEEKRLAKEEERLAKLHAKEEKKRGKKEAKELLLANDGNSKK